MTISTLEQHNPNILSSGRLCELSPNYKVDVTRTVCNTFENLLSGVEDRAFAAWLMQRRLDAEHRDMMAKVKRDLVTMAIPVLEDIRDDMQTHVENLTASEEEATAKMPKLSLVETKTSWQPPTKEDTDTFEAIFQVPERRHPLRALKAKIHRAFVGPIKKLKAWGGDWR